MKFLFRWLAFAAGLLVALWLAGFAVCRVPRGPAAEFEREIWYQLAPYELKDYFREHFIEAVARKKAVFYVDEPAGWGKLYVSSADFDACWPESPYEMEKKGYTIKARFQTAPLLFGGYGPAKVLAAREIRKKPEIYKPE